MARRPPSLTVSSPAESSTDIEPLIDALGRLTEELSGIRMVLDNVRDDLSYLIRNGLPHQPIEHVVVKRMALDPTSDDWGSHLELEVSSHVPWNTPLPDRLVDRFEAFQARVEAIAQGQLEVLLTFLTAFGATSWIP